MIRNFSKKKNSCWHLFVKEDKNKQLAKRNCKESWGTFLVSPSTLPWILQPLAHHESWLVCTLLYYVTVDKIKIQRPYVFKVCSEFSRLVYISIKEISLISQFKKKKKKKYHWQKKKKGGDEVSMLLTQKYKYKLTFKL